eukprot:scaffold130319_cov60-Phaeocystis_antarctica.AAC.3
MYSASSSPCSSTGSSTGGGGRAWGGGGPSHAGLARVAGGAFGGRGRLPREGGARRGGDEGNAEALHAEATRERGRSFRLCLVGRPLVAWSAEAGLAVAAATGLDMAAVGLSWRWLRWACAAMSTAELRLAVLRERAERAKFRETKRNARGENGGRQSF